MWRPDLLPVGYRFCPSDEELIVHYLDKKVKNEPIRCPFAVKDFDIYSKHPWEIWDMFGGNNLMSKLDKDQGLFFFTRLRKMSANSSKYARSFGGGTWHGEDAGDEITSADTNLSIGLKKRFKYKNPNSPQSGKWMMFEFSLERSKDYVLCQLRMKGEDKKFSESDHSNSGLPKQKKNKTKSEATASGGLPKQNNKKRQVLEATISTGENPRSKKPKPSSDDAPEFGVPKANSELIAADPNVIESTGDAVADEIMVCLEESDEKTTATENDEILSYTAEEDFSGVDGSQPPSLVAPITVCGETIKGIDYKEQHGVDNLVATPQSQSGVDEVSLVMGDWIKEFVIDHPFDEFLSGPDDKEVGWFDCGLTLGEIFNYRG